MLGADVIVMKALRLCLGAMQHSFRLASKPVPPVPVTHRNGGLPFRGLLARVCTVSLTTSNALPLQVALQIRGCKAVVSPNPIGSQVTSIDQTANCGGINVQDFSNLLSRH